MTQNPQDHRSRKFDIAGFVLQGITHILFLSNILLLAWSYLAFSEAGWFMIVVYMLFLPALILFLIIGSVAAKRVSKFTSTFYYQNSGLSILSILGILALAIFLKEDNDMFTPDQLTLENALALAIMFVIPCSIGFAISRKFFANRRNQA